MAERGRPRSFDRTKALDHALLAFWRDGFEATSMSDLVEAMGINSPSIYAAFGSKEALFAEAVEHYRTAYSDELLRALNGAPDAESGLAAMFDKAIALFTRPDMPGGCFVVNSVASNAPTGAGAAKVLNELRRERSQQIAERIGRDVTGGRLRSDTPVEDLSDFYATVLQGLAQTARDGVEIVRLRTVVDQSMILLSRWRTE